MKDIEQAARRFSKNSGGQASYRNPVSASLYVTNLELSEILKKIEGRFRKLGSPCEAWVDTGDGFFGFAKHGQHWRIMSIMGKDFDVGRESARPITECPQAIKVECVKHLASVRQAILDAQSQLSVEAKESVQQAEEFLRSMEDVL